MGKVGEEEPHVAGQGGGQAGEAGAVLVGLVLAQRDGQQADRPHAEAGRRPHLLPQLLELVVAHAGVGKDGAGLAALAFLQSHGLAACTVSHASARIGEANSTLNEGVISHTNALAAAIGVKTGLNCKAMVELLRSRA